MRSELTGDLTAMHPDKANWITSLPVVLLAVLLVQAALLLFPGHLAITGHEVDVLHATEAAFRLSMGQEQHKDFLTPLGILAFSPIAFFLELGFGIATANLLANLTVGAFFVPFLVWIGRRRLPGKMGHLYGILTIVMITAVVYGGDQATVSMSMYYNRWGWAAVFVIVVVLLLPDRGASPRRIMDGAIVGLMLGYLLLLKATFFVGLAPAVALVYLIDRDWRQLSACAYTGFAVCVAATLLFGGVEFWRLYLLDLLFVSSSDVRPWPGKEFTELLALPAYLPGTMCLLAAIVGLRKSVFSHEGLILFLLSPGLAYITYQNWGNDAKWLFPLAIACFVWSKSIGPKKIYGWEGQSYFLVIGFVSAALIAPSFINMASSPIRNLVAPEKNFVSVLHDPKHQGLVIERNRSFVADATVTVDGVEETMPVDEDFEPTKKMVLGEFEFSRCALKTGYYGLMQMIADDLVTAGYSNAKLAYVDVANPLPLLAPLRRLEYVSPWYYGGTRDVENADYLVVPKCPISEPTFRAYLDALNGSETAWTLQETRPYVFIFSRG